MKRRNFLSTLGLTVSGLSKSLAKSTFHDNKESKGCIKGFIVSDAHVGWKHFQQPTPNEQLKVCENIKTQFPDLDLVFDTGDAHHGYLKETERKVARTHWLSNIANQFSKTPFHYIAGNHELGKGNKDPEVVACVLGSIPMRPYYSFDYKGIHFIALPELFNTIYITQETINWLTLDLLVNQKKTTLIFSHNSIKGTTFNNGETGYRCLANSDQIAQILDTNPQIIAWFHGHNHQFEIVKQNNKLFISNGRIGGFVPPKSWGDFGQGHLGGIYFEINQQKLSVKAYSATASKFFDELNKPHLSKTLKVTTSFDNNEPFNFYMGHGASVAGVNYQCANHYLSNQAHRITYTTVNNNINEHPKLNMPTHYVFANKEQIKLIGYKFNTDSIKYQERGGDLEVNNPMNVNSFALSFPNHLNKKSKQYKRGSYYRYANNQYLLSVQLGELTDKSNFSLKLKITYLDDKYTKLFTSDFISPTNTKDHTYYFIVKKQTAELEKNPIQYFRFDLTFDNAPSSFLVKNIYLRPFQNPDNYPSLSYQGETVQLTNQLVKTGKIINTESAFSSGVRFTNIGDHVMAWLACIPSVLWQSRNATIRFNNDFIELSKTTDDISQNQNILLTPTHICEFYPNQFIGCKHVKFKIKEDLLDIELKHFKTQVKIMVVAINGNVICKQATIDAIKPGQFLLTTDQPSLQIKYVKN